MSDRWTADALLELARAYQPASILLAAAELDLFGALEKEPLNAEGLATELGADPRATRILADALTALGLLDKSDTLYSPASGVAETLTADGSRSVLPMLWHQANCMRSWVQLAATAKTGRPAGDHESIRGAEADRAAFIEAMEVASRHAAEDLIAALAPLSFQHLLDVGGGPATWTRAFLRLVPEARATLYDLPEVIPLSRAHIAAAGLGDRVEFVAGDFYNDAALPAGADLVWISAIVHQNSREQNRSLFSKVHAALVPGGELMIRDMVMNDLHTSPRAGALFAVNMLVRTESGGTYSFAELREDLEIGGFGEPTLVHGARDMDCVVRARRL
jgi:SAM-dependent methyltransferase